MSVSDDVPVTKTNWKKRHANERGASASLSGRHARPLGRSTDSTLHTDIPLTERGEHAAQELSARWKDLSFTKIFTKPLYGAYGQPSRQFMFYVL